MKGVLAFIVFVLLTTACQKEKRYDYFPDGKTIKSITEYRNSLKDGKDITYFQSGQISEITEWKDGKKNGEFKKFYKNGVLGVRVHYRAGHEVREAEIFNDLGDLIRIKFYDSLGRQTDYHDFEKNRQRTKVMEPLFWIEKDTVNLGDSVNMALRIGNVTDLRYKTGRFLMASSDIDDINIDQERTDTVKIINSSENYFPVKIYAGQRGLHALQGRIVVDVNEDILAVFSLRFVYYVK